MLWIYRKLVCGCLPPAPALKAHNSLEPLTRFSVGKSVHVTKHLWLAHRRWHFPPNYMNQYNVHNRSCLFIIKIVFTPCVNMHIYWCVDKSWALGLLRPQLVAAEQVINITRQLPNSAFHPFMVGKWVVIHVITWITGAESIKWQTWAACGCLAARSKVPCARVLA